MKHLARKRAAIIVTCVFILLSLSSCFPVAEPDEDIAESPAVTETDAAIPEPTQHMRIGNSLFTLRYDPDSSLNPITCSNADNLIITQLLYEGLFAVDSSFVAQPVLCESIETADNLEFTVKVKPDIAMSDKSTLTASDVAYSLNAARERGLYVNLLAGIESVSATDDLTVVIKLSTPNAHLEKLLDVPIIKNGTVDYRVPPGTGPYTYNGGELQYLSRFTGHRDLYNLPIPSIFLSECGNSELIEQFSDGLIDLIWDDPTDTVIFELSRQHDIRTYNTTILQFIGFSARTEALQVPAIRRAIGLAVDREYITGEIMSGYALSAPLALSPAYRLYSTTWERNPSDMLVAVSAIISEIGLADSNNDSFLEFPVPGIGYAPFSIDFIVNSENSFKMQTAQHITETLRHLGFDVTVRALKSGEYLDALEAGDFDMYLGDVALGADFDLSPLLLPDGRLNYGGTGDYMYSAYINAYFTAGSDTAESIASKQLCDLVYDNAPFIPISYKKYVMHSFRGVVSGASPSQSSVFYGLTGWTISPSTFS